MQQHDSMQISTLGTERQGGTTAAGVSLMEVSTFMTEQLKAVARMEARMDKQAVEAKAEREAMQTRLEQQQAEIQAQTEARLRAELRAQPAITESDLTTLQTRLEGLHAVELLSEAELASLEDVLADFFEASAGCDVVTMEIVNMHRAVGQVHMMIAVSKGMAKDPMFARQLKRKFC
jgi:septal ring factor EnvC (AmiA/AmiB activator)